MKFFRKKSKKIPKNESSSPLVTSKSSSHSKDWGTIFKTKKINSIDEEKTNLTFYEPPNFHSDWRDEEAKKLSDLEQNVEHDLQKKDNSMETEAETIISESSANSAKIMESPSSSNGNTEIMRPVLITVEAQKQHLDDSNETYSIDMLKNSKNRSAQNEATSSVMSTSLGKTTLDGSVSNRSETSYSYLKAEYKGSGTSELSFESSWENDSTTREESEFDATTLTSESVTVDYRNRNQHATASSSNQKVMNRISYALQKNLKDLSRYGAFSMKMAEETDDSATREESEFDATTLTSESLTVDYRNRSNSTANDLQKVMNKISYALQKNLEVLSLCGASAMQIAENTVCGPKETDENSN